MSEHTPHTEHEHARRRGGRAEANLAVLVALSEATGRRLRVYELGRRLGWEKSRLHHQLTRTSRRGLDRETLDEDEAYADARCRRQTADAAGVPTGRGRRAAGA